MVLVLKKGTSKKEIETLNKKIKSKNHLDLKKYSGIIKLNEDPLKIQKKMRDEWK